MDAYREWELGLAGDAVKAAQIKLAELSQNGQELNSREGREWKINADSQLESVIIPILQNGSNYPILSEESGAHNGIGERCWIVDPLDGSVNYSRGLPMYCISVGLWEKSQPVLGVVLDVHNNQLFTGIVGNGAKCNGYPIRVNKGSNLDPSTAILCAGFPAGLDLTDRNIGKMISLCGQFGKIRMLGSASMMLSHVACGRCDSYWECQIRLWDVAAGIAIVVAAGGLFKIGEIAKDFRVDVEAACMSSMLASHVNAR